MTVIALNGWPADLDDFLADFRRIARTTTDGTDDPGLARALRNEGLRVQVRKSKPRLSTLSQALRSRKVPILTVQQPENQKEVVLHAVILKRIDDDGTLTFIDPSIKRWFRPWIWGPTPLAPSYFLVSKPPRRRAAREHRPHRR
jgi:hypothetical protein